MRGRDMAVDAIVEEEGEDRRDRNERVRADVLGVVGVGFRIVFGIVFENSVVWIFEHSVDRSFGWLIRGS
jgi:hypothetical protein